MSTTCESCKHPLRKHYHSVDGKVYCMAVASGVTTSGVIGMPWRQECDCCDYHSETTERHEQQQAEEKAKRDAEFDKITKELLVKVKSKLKKSEQGNG